MNRQLRRMIDKGQIKTKKELTLETRIHTFGDFTSHDPFALAWRKPASGRKLARTGKLAEVSGMDNLVLYYPQEGLTDDEIMLGCADSEFIELELDAEKAKIYSDRVKSHLLVDGKINTAKICRCTACVRMNFAVELEPGKNLRVGFYNLHSFKGAYIP